MGYIGITYVCTYESVPTKRIKFFVFVEFDSVRGVDRWAAHIILFRSLLFYYPFVSLFLYLVSLSLFFPLIVLLSLDLTCHPLMLWPHPSFIPFPHITDNIKASLLQCVGRSFDCSDGILPTRIFTHKKDVEDLNTAELKKIPGECDRVSVTSGGHYCNLTTDQWWALL